MMEIDGNDSNKSEAFVEASNNVNLTTSNGALYDEALHFLEDNYIMRAYPLFGGFLRLETRKFLLQQVKK